MTANFFRKYSDLIAEAEINEKAPPGKEDWIRQNKQEFINRYGKDKGMAILYATAWKQHNEDVDYTSATMPMNEYPDEFTIGSGSGRYYASGSGSDSGSGNGSGSGSGSGSGNSRGSGVLYGAINPISEKHMGFNKLEKQLDKNSKIDNPAAVAAAIGRKKYGQVGMTRRSVAGRG